MAWATSAMSSRLPRLPFFGWASCFEHGHDAEEVFVFAGAFFGGGGEEVFGGGHSVEGAEGAVLNIEHGTSNIEL